MGGRHAAYAPQNGRATRWELAPRKTPWMVRSIPRRNNKKPGRLPNNLGRPDRRGENGDNHPVFKVTPNARQSLHRVSLPCHPSENKLTYLASLRVFDRVSSYRPESLCPNFATRKPSRQRPRPKKAGYLTCSLRVLYYNLEKGSLHAGCAEVMPVPSILSTPINSIARGVKPCYAFDLRCLPCCWR
jgi:hypothetical protein